MRHIGLFLLLIALPMFAQTGVTLLPGTYNTPPTTLGEPSCAEGYKLQRYSAGSPGNMGVHAVIPEDYGSAPGWYDVDAGPHEGDYRCVKEDKPPVVNGGYCEMDGKKITCVDDSGKVIYESQ